MNIDWSEVRAALEETPGEWILFAERWPNRGPAERASAGLVAALDGVDVQCETRRNGAGFDLWIRSVES